MAIELYHPALERTITVQRESQARIRERSGWVRKDEAEAAFFMQGVKPKPSDKKAAWVDHAVAQGMDREEAESMTKEALIEEVG